MLTLLCFVTSKQPKSKGYPQTPIKSVATTNTTHQEDTSQDAPTIRTTLFLQTAKKKNSSPSVAFWSCLPGTPEKHQVFRIDKTDSSLKTHFKTTRGKSYAYHAERILDDT